MFCAAYNNETYSKIREFLNFHDQLDKSVQRVVIEYEKKRNLIMSTVQHARTSSQFLSSLKNLPSFESSSSLFDLFPCITLLVYLYSDGLSDNRDKSLVNSWHHPNKPSIDDIIKISPDNVREWSIYP